MPGGKHVLGQGKNRVFGTAKVGDRGQIVIPQEARRFYGISPGDTLLILGNEARSEERRVGKECRSRWSPYH